ncbi:MAG: hypothetical protein HFE77_00885 [Clostridiales bacterium]|nr:hypothetical protein [Clostridiales bacterium]
MNFMNKKHGAFILAIISCLFVFASCGERADAYRLYSDMNQAMENVTSLEGAMDADMRLSVSGESIDLQLETKITAISRPEDQLDLAMTMKIAMAQLGSFNTNLYVKDGYIYQDVMGMKTKSAMETETADDLTDTYDSAVLDFAKDAIIESSVKPAEGGKELSFTLDGEKLNDSLSKLTDSFTAQLGNDIGITFSDVVYTAVVGKDNLPVTQKLTFSCHLTIEGERATADYSMTMHDFSYNNITEIEYPADLDSYQNYDADLGPSET